VAQVSAAAPGLSTVLVTGATGFIGTVVCARLLQLGKHVKAAVRNRPRATALPDAIERITVPEISDTTEWTVALKGVAAIIHLAAAAERPELDADRQREHFRTVNVEGSVRLAREAVAAGVRRFVHMSTLKVNGETSSITGLTENDAPAPQGIYAASKWEAEQRLKEAAVQSGLELVILRPPLVYGPGVRGNFLALMRAVARGVPLPLAAVRNQRSMIYVENLADAVAAGLTQAHAAGRTYLLSDGEDVSTAELVRRIATALGVRPRLVAVPPALLRAAGALIGKQEAVRRVTASLRVDCSKIRAELGWRPPFSLDEGLAETARWLKSRES
jgi:nucleoside-diphosphate-sugar epimerase